MSKGAIVLEMFKINIYTALEIMENIARTRGQFQYFLTRVYAEQIRYKGQKKKFHIGKK